MELPIALREAKKSERKRLRRDGHIPAVLYFRGENNTTISIQKSDFQRVIQQITPGTLSTVIFSLTNKGKSKRAVIKDIQYDVTTYEPIHIDFEELKDGAPLSINIPIQCTGVMDCVGIKLGGTLRQILRMLRVRCTPENIPALFEVDIKELNVGQGKRLKDIAIPAHVEPLTDLNTMAVVIAKR